MKWFAHRALAKTVRFGELPHRVAVPARRQFEHQLLLHRQRQRPAAMEQLELPTLHYAVLGRAHARALDWHFLTHHHAVAPFLALVLGGVYGLWLATGPPVRGHLLPSAGRPTGSPDCDEISYIVMNKPSSSPVTPIAPGADERRQLVDRVLASRQFAYAHSLKRILLYLCEQYTGPNQSPKEYEIALQAMGRPASFDSRLDPIVRVSVGNIRERLASYFAMDGKAEPFRMELPKPRAAAACRRAPAGPASRPPASR